jgi:hypothetical protein
MFALFSLGGAKIIVLLALLLPLSLAFTAFWVWMLVDAAKHPGLDQSEKTIWVVAIALTHFIGAAIYFFAARSKSRLALPPQCTG